jgi:DNA repair protein RecO (recombination protein O)
MASTIAYILHTRPWRETSLLLDVLSQDFGRIQLIAKGAKRPHSLLRGLLEPFTAVRIHFTGKLGLKQLTQAHWIQALNPIHPSHTLPAWYLSELCFHTLGEDDPAPMVFAAYHRAIQSLTCLEFSDDAQVILRQFEYQLLLALGLWPDARLDAQGSPLQRNALYTLSEECAWYETTENQAPWCLHGSQLLSLAGIVPNDASDFDPIPRHNAKTSLRLAMRVMLMRALHGKPLLTRRVWQTLEAINLTSITAQHDT